MSGGGAKGGPQVGGQQTMGSGKGGPQGNPGPIQMPSPQQLGVNPQQLNQSLQALPSAGQFGSYRPTPPAPGSLTSWGGMKPSIGSGGLWGGKPAPMGRPMPAAFRGWGNDVMPSPQLQPNPTQLQIAPTTTQQPVRNSAGLPASGLLTKLYGGF